MKKLEKDMKKLEKTCPILQVSLYYLFDLSFKYFLVVFHVSSFSHRVILFKRLVARSDPCRASQRLESPGPFSSWAALHCTNAFPSLLHRMEDKAWIFK